mgnify:CR=1 FL=1
MKTGKKFADISTTGIPQTAVEDVEIRNKIVCFKHRDYTGETTPDLDCKICCKIYVDKLIMKNSERQFDLALMKEKQKKSQ